jgi:ABC-type transporter Mla maintaining outer membrane lipid asymmetry ATPase subunit MlaF
VPFLTDDEPTTGLAPLATHHVDDMTMTTAERLDVRQP